VLSPGKDANKTPTENGLLKHGLLDVEPDATAKRALFERPSKHLLTGERQAMGVPNHQDPTPNTRPTGSEGHPLGEPLGKIVHATENSGIDVIKVRLVGIPRSVVRPHPLRLSIIESLVENAVRWRKGLHR
jgi:hypothetical protein